MTCGFGALGYAVIEGKKLNRLANFAFVTVSRAEISVVPILAILLDWRIGRWGGIFCAAILAAAVGSGALSVSPSLRGRVSQSIQAYRDRNAATPIGEHLAFLENQLRSSPRPP